MRRCADYVLGLIRDEREACAAIAKDAKPRIGQWDRPDEAREARWDAADDIEQAIRSRGAS
jgi:hypothetical protein